MLCPIKVNSNTIELIVHTSCYYGTTFFEKYLNGPEVQKVIITLGLKITRNPVWEKLN